MTTQPLNASQFTFIKRALTQTIATMSVHNPARAALVRLADNLGRMPDEHLSQSGQLASH